MARMCDQCEMLSINGHGCHETGCPNAWKCNTECAWCGQTFMPEERGQRCCCHSCDVSYSGRSCNCDECHIDQWQVIVGNVGTVYDGTDVTMAREVFDEYVEISKSGLGRAGNEPVTLMHDGEIDDELIPDTEYYCSAEAEQ